MMKNTWNIISFIFILFVLLIVSCSKTLQEYRIENEKAKYNFLFAVESSAFKDSVREKLIDRYKNQANIHVVENNKLEKIQTASYDVILIMGKCVAGSPSISSLKSFLRDQENLGKVVLFISTGSPGWNYTYKDLDAITAASKSGNQESIYIEISNRIERIIAGK